MAIADATEWVISRGYGKFYGIPLDTGTSTDFQAIDTTEGNKFQNDGNVRLLFLGASGATGQVHVRTHKQCNYFGGGSDNSAYEHDMVTTANALDSSSKEVVVGPIPPNIFNQGDYASMAWVTYSGTMTGVTCAVVSEEQYATL